METDLQRIQQKPNDYKVCLECGSLNFYENEHCVKCEHKIFDDTERLVTDAILDEYTQYEDLGYSEEEADNIYIDV